MLLGRGDLCGISIGLRDASSTMVSTCGDIICCSLVAGTMNSKSWGSNGGVCPHGVNGDTTEADGDVGTASETPKAHWSV